jgi:hypothetical protein
MAERSGQRLGMGGRRRELRSRGRRDEQAAEKGLDGTAPSRSRPSKQRPAQENAFGPRTPASGLDCPWQKCQNR